MSDQSAPPRRRSSIAYDPARDTFTEIPNTIPEHAVEDHDQNKSGAVYSSSPHQEPEETNGLKKRRRSVSPGLNAEPRSQKSQSPAFKRSRASPEINKSQQNTPKITSPKSEHKPAPRTISDLPRVPRRNREEGEVTATERTASAYSRRPDSDRPRQNGSLRRSQSPGRRDPTSVYRRRSPPRNRERTRSPSPIRRSPPREPIVRPGGVRGRGRNVLAEQQRLAAERERQQSSIQTNINRGVQDVSNQFYNARPEWVKEKGREWRKNESEIKGLRHFNNWIKSCIIHKFSPEEKAEPEEVGWGEEAKEPEQRKPLLVLDVGCGKGGDLGKWQLAPQPIGLYVGLDPADTSIRQAQDRYNQMRRGRRPIFDARFATQDCFGAWIGDVPIVREVGIDTNVGNGTISRFGGGGFDVVSMMFSMHYAFESEDKVKMMLRNVAGSLKKGGRFIGVVPNSDMLADRIREWFAKKKPDNPDIQNGSSEKQTDTPKDENNPDAAQNPDKEAEAPSWGNSIYNVRFPPSSASNGIPPLNPDGTFRPPVGWKYTYWMAEAVDVPEFVVPWEAFRAIAEGFNLEQRYRKPFLEVWETEKGDKEMRALASRMNVLKGSGGGDRDRDGRDGRDGRARDGYGDRYNSGGGGGREEAEPELAMSEEEKEAVAFYHAFCFVKV